MTKELIARRLLRVAFLLLMVWLVLWATSCGGKKKAVQVSEVSTEIAKVERVSELSENDIQTDISVFQSNKEKNVSVQENFQGEVADTSKEATLTVENLNGKKVYRYTNFKNVISGNQISESESNKTLEQSLSKIELSKSEKKTETDLKEKTISKNKSVSKEKQGKFPWWWIVIALVLYLAISYLRKTLNPLGWIG
jgi:hypothetical protein